MIDNKPLLVSFGAGINSTAMLIGMRDRGIRPDGILFADTGNEKPETYEFVSQVQMWTLRELGQQIFVLRHPKGDTLRDSCFRNGTLPSKAYGFPGCSVKFKHQFMESWEKKHYPDMDVIKAIGYHAGEIRRSDIEEKLRYEKKPWKYIYRYFLREWGWKQDQCEAAILAEGFKLPKKSACWFCPSSKAWEVLWLAANHPELFADSIAMERNAKPYHDQRGGITKGLGRSWSWEELVANAENVEQYRDPDPIPCMCYDGGDEMDEVVA